MITIIGILSIFGAACSIVNYINVSQYHDKLQQLSKLSDKHTDSIMWLNDTVASRILKLDKATDSDEPAALPPGEVREVVRSYNNPHKSDSWKEIEKAARCGYRMDISAKGREKVILDVHKFLSKMDRVARAARLHLDNPTTETGSELDIALKNAGVDTSRVIEQITTGE